jgi:predicted phosphodiesterase
MTQYCGDMATRLGIIGDTQGRYSLASLMQQVRRHFDSVDEVWHAGDWEYAEILDELATLAPLTVVNGNAPDDPRYPERVVREIEGWRVGMVHRPPRSPDGWASSLGICIHGHTHHWRDELLEGVRYINVSTATASSFSGDRTAGILTLGPGSADLQRVEFTKA